MHLAQQSVKIAASLSQGEVSVPRQAVLSTRPCIRSIKLYCQVPAPDTNGVGLLAALTGCGGFSSVLDGRTVLAERPGVGRAWCCSSLSLRSCQTCAKYHILLRLCLHTEAVGV